MCGALAKLKAKAQRDKFHVDGCMFLRQQKELTKKMKALVWKASLNGKDFNETANTKSLFEMKRFQGNEH